MPFFFKFWSFHYSVPFKRASWMFNLGLFYLFFLINIFIKSEVRYRYSLVIQGIDSHNGED